MSDQVVKKRGRGRPKGSGAGQQTVEQLRSQISSALRLLDKRGKPLSLLLADALEQDAPRALSAISKFLPSDVKVEGSVNLISALDEIGHAIDLELDRRSGEYTIVDQEDAD